MENGCSPNDWWMLDLYGAHIYDIRIKFYQNLFIYPKKHETLKWVQVRVCVCVRIYDDDDKQKI